MLDIIVFLLSIPIIFIVLYILNKLNRKRGKVSVKAVAVSKVIKTQTMIAASPRVPKNIVKFFMENGKYKSFGLSTSYYEKIPLRQQGVLTYQGTEFYTFEIDN